MLAVIHQAFEESQSIEVTPEYQEWREGVFRVRGDEAGVPHDQADRVYGVILDVGLGNEDGTPADKHLVVTQTAFITGEASVRTSFGGGIDGLGRATDVAALATQIVSFAQLLVPLYAPAPTRALPVSATVFMYLLTTSGVKRYSCSLREMYARGHLFGEIFARFTVIKARADELMGTMQSRGTPAELRTAAWLLRGMSSVPGVLTLAGGRVSYLACGFGSLWKWQMTKLEQATARPGLAGRMEAGEHCIVFDVSLSEIEVAFPWYYFSGGMKMRVGGVPYRLSFGRPSNMPGTFSPTDGFGRGPGALADVLEVGAMRRRGKAWKRALSSPLPPL